MMFDACTCTHTNVVNMCGSTLCCGCVVDGNVIILLLIVILYHVCILYIFIMYSYVPGLHGTGQNQ